MASFYGNCYDPEHTAELLKELVAAMPRGGLWAVAGDFNLRAADVQTVLAEAPVVVVAPDEHTCFPSLGEPSCLDFFVVSPALANVLGRCRVVRGVELATHRPVILEVVLRKGPPLTRWIRPKAQEYEKVYGPRICTPWTSELLERMDQQQWRRPVVG